MNCKRLLVLGGTGKTGQQLLVQALERDLEVVALVRDPTRIPLTHPRLTPVRGDVLDGSGLPEAFATSVDAVVSALGMFHREPRTDLSRGTANVVRAMESHGVGRLVAVSSVGAGDSKGQGSLLAKWLQFMLLRHVLDDKDRQEALIAASALAWTVIRPPQLTDERRIRDDLVAWTGRGTAARRSWKVSRASVAYFALEAIAHDRWLRQAVNISDPA